MKKVIRLRIKSLKMKGKTIFSRIIFKKKANSAIAMIIVTEIVIIS
jgi:hypothetical protein